MISLGIVEKVIGNEILIKKEEWAPAIWCGSRGSFIKAFNDCCVSNKKIKILGVNFRDKKLYVDDASGVQVDDLLAPINFPLFFKKSTSIEYVKDLDD